MERNAAGADEEGYHLLKLIISIVEAVRSLGQLLEVKTFDLFRVQMEHQLDNSLKLTSKM